MKILLSIASVIVCVIVLVIGQLHWNNKITDISASNAKVNETVSEDRQNNLNNRNDIEPLLAYTKNWPKESVTTLKTKIREGKPFKIAFLGSNAAGEGKDSWPEIVKSGLGETYDEYISVSTFSYDLTSLDFVNTDKISEIIAEQPDLIVFEPFTLKDNGIVTIEDSLDNASTVLADVKKSLPHTVVVMQPAHPLYNAKFYPLQVDELKAYAEEQGVTYINHWEAWPDLKDEVLKEYIVEDSTQPTAKGHQVWADYLLKYFIVE